MSAFAEETGAKLFPTTLAYCSIFSSFDQKETAIIFQRLGKMFGAVQPKTPDAVLAALVQHGAAIGPK